MHSKAVYIDVAVAFPVHQTFSYAVPDHLAPLATVGKRVLAPFGRRRIAGYITGVTDAPHVEDIKNILDVLDDSPMFPASMVPFFQWIADYYIYPLGLVIKNALPGGFNYTERYVLAISEAGRRVLAGGLTTPLEKKVLTRLAEESSTLKRLEMRLALKIPSALVLRMLKDGWLSRQQTLHSDRIRPKTEKMISLSAKEIPQKKTSAVRRQLIDMLRRRGELSLMEIRKEIPNAAGIINAMAKAGHVRIDFRRVYRDPFGEPVSVKAPPKLTPEQEKIVADIKHRFGNAYETFLLAGVTGSGKTEVYLQLALAALERNLSVLVLVPEIALISQMERRFRARFGDGIAVLHSGLSQGERYDQWQKIIQGNVRIAIGARSAIFAPLDNLGIIIVDEEHDTSYKQESSLRYHARDLAVVRARQLRAVALLGSATPSIQTYHNAVTRKYALVQLTKRVEMRSLPDIEIVDLCRLRDRRGHRRYISDELHSALKQTMDRGEQAILFLNRRGYANFPVCASCGKPVRCKHCDISLTYHKNRNAYQCHYCGFSLPSQIACPSCGASTILNLGLGTEKVEIMISALFPDKQIVRMDRDTVQRKGAVVRILKGLKNRSTDILIGTQMVAKGHDFPDITLVGILCADLSLNFPDFRAGEQTFQLLAQVSGRAGRGDRPGKVVLQTYNPDHFSIVCAQNEDFRAFYEKETEFRKSLGYPPFSRMIQIVVSSRVLSAGLRQVRALESRSRDLLMSDRRLKNNVTVMGPVEAPLSKIGATYRWHMLLKSSDILALHAMARRLLFNNPALSHAANVKTVVDVDPVFMM